MTRVGVILPKMKITRFAHSAFGVSETETFSSFLQAAEIAQKRQISQGPDKVNVFGPGQPRITKDKTS